MNRLTKTTFLLTTLFLLSLVTSLYGAIEIPGADGSDGEFAPTESIEVDLSLATTGSWDTTVTEEDKGKGVYDPDKWAIVFKYSSVNIPEGVTVTFKNHPSFAPVVWLVTGNVVIAGTLDVGAKLANRPQPGPGGFHGGLAPGTQLGFGPGIGPGGKYNAHADHTTGERNYGNAKIIPLVGGSGGSGHTSAGDIGGGGGGAILIASAESITLIGKILANVEGASGAWDGSAGSIRLITDNLQGNGSLEALVVRVPAGRGRIRLEANSFTNSLIVNPFTKVVPPDSPVLLWPLDTTPTARIVSVAEGVPPTDPRYTNAYATADPDISFDTTDPVNVIIETTNVNPISGTVQLFVKPIRGQDSILDAIHDVGDEAQSTWTVSDVNLPRGAYVLQVRAVTD